MAQVEAVDAPSAARRRTARAVSDNLLVRGVARAPAKVRTKLLVAFLVVAALLVVNGAVGLRFLAQSNGRVQSLGAIQLRSTQYQAVQSDSNLVRQLLGLRAANSASTLFGTTSAPAGGRSWVSIDHTISF